MTLFVRVWPFFNCSFIVTSFCSEWLCCTDWRHCTEVSWVQVVTNVSCKMEFKDSQVFINEPGVRWCCIFTVLKLGGLICCSFPGTMLVFVGYKEVSYGVVQNLVQDSKSPRFIQGIKIHFWQYIWTFWLPHSGRNILYIIKQPLMGRNGRGRVQCIE